MPVRLHVWGDHACFTRPEMKVERVSYDVMAPSAARGILEAVYWQPAIRWHIDKIHVLKPIRFQSFRRNEVGAKASARLAAAAMGRGTTQGWGLLTDKHRQQRSSLLLVDVAYVIEAYFELTASAGPDETASKHFCMFTRRASRGQCFHRPCLGTREFTAEFALLANEDALPHSELAPEQRDADFGWMLHDIDFAHDNTAHFFRAEMRDGVIHVPRAGERSPMT